MLDEANGAPASTPEPPSLPVVADDPEVRQRAREALRGAIDAGKVGFASSFDAVRFQVAVSVPTWVLRGAWEEVRPSLAPPTPPEPAPPAEEPWDGQGAEHDAAPHDHLEELEREAPAEQKPTIRVIAGDLSRMIRDCIRALGEGDHNLFQRAGQLVQVVREPERREPYEKDARRGRDILTRPGTPKLFDAAPVLLERADAVARWMRFDARMGSREGGKQGGKASGEWVPSNPDATTVKQIAARRNWPGIRPIRGILETPCLAPSERIIQAPGYDEETGYLLLPSCDVGPIADAPPREHARRALRWLWTETACDFPFRDLGEPDGEKDPDRIARYDRALEVPDAFVGLATLLAIFARGAIAGAVPAAVFEAAGQGSGKSLQIHVNAMIATSRAAGVATFPIRDGRPNEEELEKVLAGYALAGARIIAFDNIRGLLAGGTLEKALTAVDTIDLRVLGANDQRSLPWWAVLLFSGNNMVMSDDVAQRSLVSRLESPREDPRSRPSATFRHSDLLGWIKEHRPRLVRAALVILRSFLAARSAGLEVPDPGTRGSFEAWARIVPGALMWAGGPNILRAFPEAGRGGDEEGEAHATLMRWWQPAWQSQRASVILDGLFRGEKDAAQGGPDDGLGDARAAARSLTRTREREVPSSHTLAVKLSGLRGKIRGGLRIEVERDKSTNASIYRVVDTSGRRT